MLLMEEAERIAREEHGSVKLAVISGTVISIKIIWIFLLIQRFYPLISFIEGVGTRNYYRKMGYELDGPYMSKMI